MARCTTEDSQRLTNFLIKILNTCYYVLDTCCYSQRSLKLWMNTTDWGHWWQQAGLASVTSPQLLTWWSCSGTRSWHVWPRHALTRVSLVTSVETAGAWPGSRLVRISSEHETTEWRARSGDTWSDHSGMRSACSQDEAASPVSSRVTNHGLQINYNNIADIS